MVVFRTHEYIPGNNGADILFGCFLSMAYLRISPYCDGNITIL